MRAWLPLALVLATAAPARARQDPSSAAPAKNTTAPGAPAKATAAPASPAKATTGMPASAAKPIAAAPTASTPPVPLSPEDKAVAEKLERERAVSEALAQREGTLLGRLAELERQIEIEGRAYRAAQARLKQAQGRLALSEAKARAADAEVDKASDALGPRLTARYRMGREGYVRFLLGARSISDILRRKRLYAALLERDFEALATLRFVASGARAARDDLARARDDLAASVQAEADKRAALEARSGLQKRMLASVKKEKGVHDRFLVRSKRSNPHAMDGLTRISHTVCSSAAAG